MITTATTRRRWARYALIGAVAMTALAACGSDDADPAPSTQPDTASTDTASTDTASTDTTPSDTTPSGPITVYSGRGEDLIGPVIERFTAATGIKVNVRYGDSAEMLLLIQEEGANSPADVYLAQGAGFLGLLSEAGSLATLPSSVLERVVDPALRSPADDWVGVSGRARTVVYNTDRLTEADLPTSFVDFTDPVWSGRIGWAPTNASFQDHVTAMRSILGEAETRSWLEGIMANNPVAYERNTVLVEAVAAGEVDVAFTNHYYLYRYLAENPDFAAANKFYSDGDVGAFVNIAGAGILSTSERTAAALAFIEFLLSPEAQELLSNTNFELPVIANVDPPADLVRIDSLVLPAFDLNLLTDLEGTVDLLIAVGAL